MEIRYLYRDYIPVYTDGSRNGNSVACATVFPSNIVISMKLPYSVSMVTSEVWAIINAKEQIKDSVASNEKANSAARSAFGFASCQGWCTR